MSENLVTHNRVTTSPGRSHTECKGGWGWVLLPIPMCHHPPKLESPRIAQFRWETHLSLQSHLLAYTLTQFIYIKIISVSFGPCLSSPLFLLVIGVNSYKQQNQTLPWHGAYITSLHSMGRWHGIFWISSNPIQNLAEKCIHTEFLVHGDIYIGFLDWVTRDYTASTFPMSGSGKIHELLIPLNAHW